MADGKKRPIKRQSKLAGKINQLARTDAHAAGLLAMRGRPFTQFESFLSLYYQTLQKASPSGAMVEFELLKMIEQDKQEYRDAIKRFISEDRHAMAEMFITAIDSRDWETVMDMAKAIKFLKSFKPSGDKYRAEILMWKGILGDEPRWYVEQLARAIGYPESASENGFWAVRRMAKELKFPLKSKLK